MTYLEPTEPDGLPPWRGVRRLARSLVRNGDPDLVDDLLQKQRFTESAADDPIDAARARQYADAIELASLRSPASRTWPSTSRR